MTPSSLHLPPAAAAAGRELHVLYSFPTRIGVPGIGTTAWHHVNELTKQGIRVTLCCGSCERPIPGLHRLIETMNVRGLKLPYRLFGNDRAFRMHDRAVARTLRQLAGRVDVVHCWPLGSLATLDAARAMGVPSVLERPNAHTAFAYEAVAREHKKLGLPVPTTHTHAFSTYRLEREEAEYSAADVLVCPSEFVASSFAQRGISPDRLARSQYGFEPGQFWAEPRNGSPTARPFTALFVGRCEPRKGLHYALQAWHESGAAQHGKFVICGTYVAGYREYLRRWLDHPSIEERGFISTTAEEMRKADVLVLPSVEEGSALVTYEARASGCVLLVSSASGAVAEHNVNALVHAPGNVAELCEHLRLVSADPALLNRLRSASLSAVEQLTWSAAATVLRTLYHNACHVTDAGGTRCVPACETNAS